MRHPISPRILAACLCVGTAALAVPATGLAKTKYKTVTTSQTLSFAGSCSFDSAGVSYAPGLQFLPRTTTATIEATGGNCNDGSSTARLAGTVTGVASCHQSTGALTGIGTLSLSNPYETIPVKLSLSIAYPNGTLTVSGTTSGSATGNATFLKPGNLGAAPSCFEMPGATEGTFDANNLMTSSPITSVVTVSRKVKVTPKPKQHKKHAKK